MASIRISVQPLFSWSVEKSRSTSEAKSMLTIGWLVVLLGLLAIEWADNGGDFLWPLPPTR
jgi:hypothetical protein